MKKSLLLFSFLLLGQSVFADINVGALFAVTGPASFLGLPEKQTLEMLVDKINKSGGIKGEKINLTIYDTRSVDDEARKKFQRLVQVDKVVAVVGPTTSGESLAIKELAESSKIPLISCASSDRIVEPLEKHVFKVAPSDEHAVQKIYEYLQHNGKKKIGIVTIQNGFGDSGRAALLAEAKKFGITVVADEKFMDSDKDMTPQLTKINAKNPDAVICWAAGSAPAIVVKNYKQLGLKPQLIMSHGVASKKFIELAGGSADGILLPAGRLIVYNQLKDNDVFKKLLADYAASFEGEFKQPVSTFGGHAYDAFQVLKIAIEKGGKSAETIAATLEKIKGYKGTYGEFNFSDKDHCGLTKDAFVMIKIQDGNWKLID